MHFSCSLLKDVPNLKEKWCELEKKSADNFMLSWTWIGTWLKIAEDYYGDEFLRKCYVIQGFSGEEVISLAILVGKRDKRHGFISSQQLHLHRLGEDDFDIICQEYNGILTLKGREGDITEEFTRYMLTSPQIQTLCGRWDELVVSSAEPQAVDPFLISGLTRELKSITSSYIVDLAAVRASEKPYLAGLSKNTRYQINRSVRLYNEKGGVKLQFAKTPDEAFDFFKESADLHKARWEAKGQISAYDNPIFMDFHKSLMKEAWDKGEVDVIRLSLGEEDQGEMNYLGMLYNFIHHGEVYFYMSALRYEDNPKLKPGLVVHSLAIEKYLKRKMNIYNFMAGDSQYKKSLGVKKEYMMSYYFKRFKLSFVIEEKLKQLKQFFKK